MSTLKQFSEREIKKILRKNGYRQIRSCGSHAIYKNDKQQEITIPGGREPNKMMMRRLIKENNLAI